MNPSQDDNARFDLAKQQEAIRMSEIEGQRLLEEDIQLEMGMKEMDHLLGLDSEMEIAGGANRRRAPATSPEKAEFKARARKTG